MIGIKNDIKFQKTLKLSIDSYELVGAEIVIDHGQKVNVFSVYCTPGWGLNSHEVGDALAVVSHPMLVLGDLNTHSHNLGVVTQKTVVRVRWKRDTRPLSE
jgi:endonuclease/exonuclease/phosphatase (EEP) superfamily protein YafD